MIWLLHQDVELASYCQQTHVSCLVQPLGHEHMTVGSCRKDDSEVLGSFLDFLYNAAVTVATP